MRLISLLILSISTHFIVPSEIFGYDFNKVEYIRNYDGDTLKVNIKGIHPLLGRNISIRLADIDTAEIGGSKKCEQEMAKLAQSCVENLIIGSDRVDIKNAQRGKYFRVVADVYLEGFHLNTLLLKLGLAVHYSGGKRPDVDWCEMLVKAKRNRALNRCL